MNAPMYHSGLHKRTPDEVHSDTVADYPLSQRRPEIWSGLQQIIALTSQMAPTEGELLLDDEMVDLINEPLFGKLAFLSRTAPTIEQVNFWKSRNAKEWNCDTYLLGPRPDEPQAAADWDAVHEVLLRRFTDSGRKGVPIMEFSACLSHTKTS